MTQESSGDAQSPLKRWLPLLLVVATFLVYASTLRFEFVYDDQNQVLGNPLIRSWHNLPLIFKSDVWRFVNPAQVGNYWRPLFVVWLLLNQSLFGLHPLGFHLTTVLVHVAATYCCYRLVLRVAGDTTLALVAAALFAVHAAHVETVAWVSGVTDSLMTVFFLGALLCFLRGWENQGWGWHAASGALFGCALMAKETAIVLPAVVLGYVLCFGPRRWRAVAGPMTIYAVIAAAYWVARKSALEGITHSPVKITASQLLMTWPELAWFYIKHLLWPVRLSVFYDLSPVMKPTLQNFWLPLVGVLLAIGAFAMWAYRTNGRLLAFATMLLVLPLAPAFVFPALVPNDFAHDRYLYLPCLGFAIMVGVAIEQIRAKGWTILKAPAWKPAAIVVFVFAVLNTMSQSEFWASNLLLFARAAKVAPARLEGFVRLGQALLARGDKAEADYVFQEVLQRDPRNWTALYNVGLMRLFAGDYQQAEGYLARAAEVSPADVSTRAALAEARTRLSGERPPSNR